MIIRGRSIYANSATAGNLTRYLLHNPKNERAVFLGGEGTAFPDDLEKSIQQMVLMGELSRSDKPLYFTALSPDLNVDKALTEEEWEIIRLAQAKALGLEAQPFAWVEHQKYGDNGELRIHRHVVYQRYDIENGRMISDEYDRRNNARARAEIEETLGHDRTFQRWTLEEMQQLERQQEIEKEETIKAERLRLEMIEAEKERQRKLMLEMLQNSDDIEVAEELKPEDPWDKMMRMYEMQKQQNHNQGHSY